MRNRKNTVRVIAFERQPDGNLCAIDVYECDQCRRSHLNPRQLKQWAYLHHGRENIAAFRIERRKTA